MPSQRQAAELAGRTGQPVFVTLAEQGIVGALPGRRPRARAGAPRPRADRHRRRRRRRHRQPGRGPGRRANLREAMELAMAAASLVIHQLGTTGTASVSQIAGLSTQG